jgi:GntR family transcriptional regulator, rspAB operon transcriptional repressor
VRETWSVSGRSACYNGRSVCRYHRHAYEQLRSKILLGELAPGATFSQVQLASQLGISRTPLREAVRLLQTEGLLDSEPNRRVRVSPLTTEDFEDL